MTDKQIIIDGVDVSGCENFSCGICEEAKKIPRTINHFTADCRMYPNCYYKQLQREKQNSQEARDTAIKEFNRAEELKTLLKRKEQKLIKIKQYIEDNEWCILDEMCKDIEQIIESKEGDNL